MKLVIVSGRSGSGKSTALHVLEDVGFYCIDNLPIGLLFPLIAEALHNQENKLSRIAVSIDARNLLSHIPNFDEIYQQLKTPEVEVEVVYLDADSQVLMKRFNATRRKHPLSNLNNQPLTLKEAINEEALLLEPMANLADLKIDTSNLGIYELRDLIKERIVGHKYQELALQFQSFGFKYGTPPDSDYVFDVRCLANPYWHEELRQYTGLEEPVQKFLKNERTTGEMISDIDRFLNHWLPLFKTTNRTYMTISVGCTGGKHRSVFVCEELRTLFENSFSDVQVRHRDLPKALSGRKND